MTDVKLTGPIFDGSADWILTQGVENARRAVAEEGKRLVKMETGKFQNPTGAWEGELHIKHSGFISWILPGQGHPFNKYTRWLEGTSRRNFTTRFGGYHLFRNARQTLEMRVGPLVEQQLRPVIRRLNG